MSDLITEYLNNLLIGGNPNIPIKFSQIKLERIASSNGWPCLKITADGYSFIIPQDGGGHKVTTPGNQLIIQINTKAPIYKVGRNTGKQNIIDIDKMGPNEFNLKYAVTYVFSFNFKNKDLEHQFHHESSLIESSNFQFVQAYKEEVSDLQLQLQNEEAVRIRSSYITNINRYISNNQYQSAVGDLTEWLKSAQENKPSKDEISSLFNSTLYRRLLEIYKEDLIKPARQISRELYNDFLTFINKEFKKINQQQPPQPPQPPQQQYQPPQQQQYYAPPPQQQYQLQQQQPYYAPPQQPYYAPPQQPYYAPQYQPNCYPFPC